MEKKRERKIKGDGSIERGSEREIKREGKERGLRNRERYCYFVCVCLREVKRPRTLLFILLFP